MTLTFNPLRAMIMTYSHAKVQGQRLVCSEDRVETNERTDRRTDRRTEAIVILSPLQMRSVITSRNIYGAVFVTRDVAENPRRFTFSVRVMVPGAEVWLNIVNSIALSACNAGVNRNVDGIPPAYTCRVLYSVDRKQRQTSSRRKSCPANHIKLN